MLHSINQIIPPHQEPILAPPVACYVTACLRNTSLPGLAHLPMTRSSIPQRVHCVQENAAQLCETLRSDVSALRQLSEDTLSDVDPEVMHALAQAVEEQEAMRADLEAARREHNAAAASSHAAVAAAEAARASALDAAAEAAAQFEEARVELAAVEAERQQLRLDLHEQCASSSCLASVPRTTIAVHAGALKASWCSSE